MSIQNRIKELRYVPASELKANPKNWRKHPAAQQKMLKTMFKEVGYVDALIGRELDDGSVELIDGHLRQETSGNQDVPVLILDVTQEEADLILASFDPITGMADTDKSMMKDLLQNIETDDADVSAMLDKLAKDANVDLYDDQPEPEAKIEIADELQVKWNTELGQLWQVGKHRILCGDCTDEKLVERLMDGQTIDLCVTSPPYENQREYSQWKTYQDYLDFINEVILSIKRVLSKNSTVAWNMGSSESTNNFIPADNYRQFLDNGFTWIDWIIWRKKGANFSIPRSQHISKGLYIPALCWESITVYKIGKRNKFDIDDVQKIRDEWQLNVWDIDQVVGSAQSKIGHPAMFPVELPKRCVMSYTKTLQNIFDPFLGSHTTMIAAEQTGRICYGMELDPKYVAVGLERMSEMGLKPELIDG